MKKSIQSIIIFLVLLFTPYMQVNAKPESLDEGFYVISSLLDRNRVLDINERSQNDGANVQLWERNDTMAQVFYVSRTNDGYYHIAAVCSGKLLDIQYGNKNSGTNVWQYTENGTDAQKWDVRFLNDNSFEIKSKLGDFNLDVYGANTEKGTNIQIWEPNNTNAQKFRFESVDIEKVGVFQSNRNYATRIMWVEDYVYNYYISSHVKNVLVLGEKSFLKSFNKIFKSQNNFKFDVSESVASVEDVNKYDLIINTKYDIKFLNVVFKNKKIENFVDVYRPALYQTAIDYLKKNNIPIYFFDAPKVNEINNWNETDKRVLFGPGTPNDNDIPFCQDFLNRVYKNNEECKKYFMSGEYIKGNHIIKVKNHFALADFKGKYHNIINNHRLVVNAYKNPKNTVYMYGPCTMRSKYVPDNYTIEKFMQERVNREFPQTYNFVGCGVESDEINDFEYILDTTFKPGDIVIEERDFSPLLKNIVQKNGCTFKKLSVAFDKPNMENWMVNCITHLNHNGNKIVSNFMYDCIRPKIKENVDIKFEDKFIKFHESDDFQDNNFIKDNPDFNKYLKKLKLISKDYRKSGEKIGSLNVNCNPFTLGHRYLIEESLKKVDHLYLFVVEEDASDFSFKDRYEMVKRGIADLKNITLLKTGKWMCSKFTFPDYFNKDDLQGKIILNPTKDIDLYGRYIAPALGATIRFAGEEPLDLITRQHNNFMRNKLPEYGVEFCEIPRKTLKDGQVISASRVRKYLKERNLQELKKFVPKTTYDYLIENFT